MNAKRLQVAGSRAGCRIDSYLRDLGIAGLRPVRRMIAGGHVLVNGHAVACAQKLRPGDVVEVLEPEMIRHCEKLPVFLGRKDDYCFFYKPAGLNTVRLAGCGSASLEAMLPGLLPEETVLPILLQRLDRGTAGIICAARNMAAAVRYREMEKQGLCVKYYYVLLRGCLNEKRLLKNVLDCDNRKRVRVLREEAPKLGWTFFEPLWRGNLPEEHECGEVTLARCELHSGQRHQIRAHAACMGHPLVGDPLYGVSVGENFGLAHYELSFPGLRVKYLAEDSFVARIFVKSLAVFSENEVGLCIS